MSRGARAGTPLAALVMALALLAALPAPLYAQNEQAELIKRINFRPEDQKLDALLPLELEFFDETGKAVRLGDYFNRKPVILTLVYYECPMLCTQVLNGLVQSLTFVPQDIGKDYDVVTVSFDPKEKPSLAARKKQTYLKRYGREGAEAGWHFLVGSPESIKALTEAVGFHYEWDPKTRQYAHPSMVVVATPKGKIARYFYGIEYAPRDMKFGLAEAAEERILGPVDQLLLLCYHYDPLTGKYGVAILNILRLAGLATVLALGSFMVVMFRREKRRIPQPADAALTSTRDGSA